MRLGIVTTTYNRKKLLKRLYKSLEEQIDQTFIWIVIDDGSTDETSSYINNLSSSFAIRYIYKKNEGKAKALNYAFTHNDDIDLFIIVDSDDYLLSTAVSIIRESALKYASDTVGALFFKYQYESGEILGDKSNTYHKPVILSRIEHDAQFDKIDGCICYFNKSVQKYRYPEFKNENYVGPTVIQMEMDREYKIAFLTDVIGVAEYQESGLTNAGRKLRLQNPKSMLVYCYYMQDKRFNMITRIKYGIMSNAYFHLIDDNETITGKLNLKIPKYFSVFGKALAFYWKTKSEL